MVFSILLFAVHTAAYATLPSSEMGEHRWLTGTGRRLVFNDDKICLPEAPTEPIVLTGVNMMFILGKSDHELEEADRSVSAHLPRLSMVRLLANHWLDEPTWTGNHASDCYTDAAPFITNECLRFFDDILRWSTTELGGVAPAWSVLTGRSSLAAGDGGVELSVMHNLTLRAQWATMWGTIAARYADWDNIAGYEVLSEPRDDSDPEALRATLQAACRAIWSSDARAACIVGPARFYNKDMLSESLVLSGGPQILAVNFFEPKVWSYNNDGDGDVHVPTYPGLYDCCAVTDAVRKRQVCGMLGKTCPAAPRVLVDKKWISAELGRLAEFASHVGRPVWIDQFGMQSTDDAALKAQAKLYLSDMLSLANSMRLHWNYWIWRRPQPWPCGEDGDQSKPSFALLCQKNDGTYQADDTKLSAVRAYMPSLRTAQCAEFDPAADLQSLPNPEWCNTNRDRRRSRELCEAAHVTVYMTPAGRKMHRCVHNSVANECTMQQEPFWCLRVPEPSVCELVRPLTELRQRRQWCATDPERRASKAACEETYVRVWTGTPAGSGVSYQEVRRCVYDDREGKCFMDNSRAFCYLP